VLEEFWIEYQSNSIKRYEREFPGSGDALDRLMTKDQIAVATVFHCVSPAELHGAHRRSSITSISHSFGLAFRGTVRPTGEGKGIGGCKYTHSLGSRVSRCKADASVHASRGARIDPEQQQEVDSSSGFLSPGTPIHIHTCADMQMHH